MAPRTRCEGGKGTFLLPRPVRRPGGAHMAGENSWFQGLYGAVGTAGDKGAEKIDTFIPLQAFPEILNRLTYM